MKKGIIAIMVMAGAMGHGARAYAQFDAFTILLALTALLLGQPLPMANLRLAVGLL